MASNPLGPSVTRYLSTKDRQYVTPVFNEKRPPLDSELNLIALSELEARAEEIRSRMASGWLMNELNPMSDYQTSQTYSNMFFFGRNDSSEQRNLNWAVVNGWLIPVTGTQTGQPPLAANNNDYWNKILLNPPSSSTGGNKAEFVFLEVWLSNLLPDSLASITASGKPERGFVYRFGNVEGGFSFLPDEMIDPNVYKNTTGRVQIQYRIRVVQNVGLSLNPEGFDPSVVFAQGLLSSPSSIPFENMRKELGDPGLWRAGSGDPSTFGTVDGYVYAIPLCVVFRRSSSSFSDVGNLAGAFNRNGSAVSRLDSKVYTNSISLQSDLSEAATSFSLTSITGSVLETITDYSEAYFKIDEEIVRVTDITAVSPTNYIVTISRGQLQTITRSHKTGAGLLLYTVRPDGLFADQVSSSDILDLRHSVADKFDYDSILNTNLNSLLKGNLRSTWKRFGSSLSSGSVVLFGDRITDGSVSVGGLSLMDAPDGNRRVYSDAVTTQRFVVPVTVPSNSASLNSPINVSVAPYDITVLWSGAPPTHGVGQRLSGGSYPSWWNGDQITITKSNFTTGLLGSDSDQVRFVKPEEDIDSIILRFDGMTSDPNGGTPSSNTIQSASNPFLSPSPSGELILKNGSGFTTAIDINDNLVITLDSGTLDTEFQEFKDALQGNGGSGYSEKLKLFVEFTVVYGAGRGLSHKPDYIHSIHFKGNSSNTSKTLVRNGLSDKTRMIPVYLSDSPYVQTGVDKFYAKTSEVMIDPGSKTVVVAPYKNVVLPPLVARNGNRNNWYGLTPSYQGCMPLLSLDGSTSAHTLVDPLGLFYRGSSDSRYLEIPMEYLPKPGFHYSPIVPVSNSVFSSGINFLLMANSGSVSSSSNYNRNLVSYPSTSGFYIVTPKIGETYGNSNGSFSIFGAKYTNSSINSASGGSFKGVKFPPFLAPARITGVYLRNGTSVLPVSSPFSTDRSYVGGVGTDVNLLKDSFDGPTFLLDVDSNGDLYFILNADILDLSRAPDGTTFDNSDFLVECVLFGYDRGFLQTNGRVLITKSAGSSTPITVNSFTDSEVGLITTAPLTKGASQNEVTIYYSRTPYQGDVFGTQASYSDDLNRKGPLTISESTSVFNNPLSPVQNLTLSYKKGFEILSSVSFSTSLGTGRLSGPSPIPLLNPEDAPNNPPDVLGTRTDLYRRFSLNRIGYEDWNSIKFPMLSSSVTVRPEINLGGLSEVYDGNITNEYAGCTTRLPLGSYFRDKDFVGKTLYQVRSTNNVGTTSIGTLSFFPYEPTSVLGAEGKSTWEGTEFVCGNSSGVSGDGTDQIVMVDGTYNVNDTSNFKTTRGGAAYSVTKPWPGGTISSKLPKAKPNSEVGSVLSGTAFLVRSCPEIVSGSEVHSGSELQMVIITHASPSYTRESIISHSANGHNEGYTAVDRFRLLGKPLEKRRITVDTSLNPNPKPLFQNQVMSNPLYYGSSDRSLVSPIEEVLTVSTDGQTVFILPGRPVDPTTVMLFINGIKATYGSDYTVSGPSNTVLTYIGNILNPTLLTSDKVAVWYILF